VQAGGLALGVALEPSLGDPDRRDPVEEHGRVPLPVVFEGLAIVVEVPAVELDDQLGFLEVGVAFVTVQHDVDPRRPQAEALDTQTEDAGPSPLETAIGHQAVERYEEALSRLRPEDREAIIGRIELGLTNEELAETLGKPSPNAARMAVERALFRLAKEMRRPIADSR